MDTSILLLGMLSGSIGLGYFWYGRRQKAPVPLVCGLVLMAIPWFVSSAVVLLLVGAAACIVPWLWRI